ncbi:MAG: MFS transporter [Phenylobacterium sp.]|jgi:MFS family permease|uniref:spinster family MFS transporter n=1 Tax=Phenylobacterium sp. TaxID=1871053 RepID=UPI002A35A3E3|nr:MFS transporter [Phenylobacterium sp.]MDX9998286.1 MFS transporter [Phenylobacterium sp.]
MTDAAAAPFAGHGTRAYRAWVLFALLVVYTFNFIDRVLVSIVQEPIRAEFNLTDTQLGLLGGPTFAILYTLLGIPIARLAERKNRMTILAVCVGLWSAMTAACGMATSYATLLLARIGVSIGEAGCTPPAQSVIADYFPEKSRATALSIYALGIPIGSMLAAVGGGIIAEAMGWREAFLTLGLPGLVLAILVKLTVKEPPRAGAAIEAPGLRETASLLSKKSAFWYAAFGGAMASFVGYGVGQFTNSFFMRSHELSILQASQITGLLLGAFGAIGTFISGWLADRIRGRYPNAIAWLPAVGFMVAGPLNVFGYMSGSLPVAVALLAVAQLGGSLYLGSMYAIAQGVVHPRMRATAVAVLLFVVNLIGYAGGPPAIGALSDLIANRELLAAGLSLDACRAAVSAGGVADPACTGASEVGLRWAIILGYSGLLLAAAFFLMSWRTVRRDWHEG